jgi:hypothetical protein
MLLAILETSATARREKGECPMDKLFLTDIMELRRRARSHMEEGAVTVGLWGMKYSDADDKWWVELLLQDAPPSVRVDQVDGRVVTDGFDGVTGPVLVHKASIPPEALNYWPSDTPVILTRVELGPETSLSTS